MAEIKNKTTKAKSASGRDLIFIVIAGSRQMDSSTFLLSLNAQQRSYVSTTHFSVSPTYDAIAYTVKA